MEKDGDDNRQNHSVPLSSSLDMELSGNNDECEKLSWIGANSTSTSSGSPRESHRDVMQLGYQHKLSALRHAMPAAQQSPARSPASANQYLQFAPPVRRANSFQSKQDIAAYADRHRGKGGSETMCRKFSVVCSFNDDYDESKQEASGYNRGPFRPSSHGASEVEAFREMVARVREMIQQESQRHAQPSGHWHALRNLTLCGGSVAQPPKADYRNPLELMGTGRPHWTMACNPRGNEMLHDVYRRSEITRQVALTAYQLFYFDAMSKSRQEGGLETQADWIAHIMLIDAALISSFVRTFLDRPSSLRQLLGPLRTSALQHARQGGREAAQYTCFPAIVAVVTPSAVFTRESSEDEATLATTDDDAAIWDHVKGMHKRDVLRLDGGESFCRNGRLPARLFLGTEH